MKEKAFLSHKIDIAEFDKNEKIFERLPIGDQKKFLLETLDTNQLYINFNEINDKDYHIASEDKELNDQFYKGSL